MARWSVMASAVVVLAGCARQPVQFAAVRQQMGTAVKIVVTGRDQRTVTQAGEAAFRKIEQLNGLLSDYLAASDVSRISAAAGGQPQTAAADTFAVIELALLWWRKTGGAFDPTVRPAIGMWREAAADDELPSDQQLAAVRKLIGAGKIELDRRARTIRLPAAGMSLDLGGIAKGYIVDQAATVLRARGIRSALIDAGGDVLLIGGKTEQAPWSVAVENPPPGSAHQLVLALRDCAVATSGDYRRGVYIHGKHYSHIIDPRTARPAERAASVSVIAPDLTTADALATALSVMPPDEGISLIDSLRGIEALILSRQGAMLCAVTSKGFAESILDGRDRLAELQHGQHQTIPGAAL